MQLSSEANNPCQVDWLYFVAFGAVTIGLVIYSGYVIFLINGIFFSTRHYTATPQKTTARQKQQSQVRLKVIHNYLPPQPNNQPSVVFFSFQLGWSLFVGLFITRTLQS